MPHRGELRADEAEERGFELNAIADLGCGSFRDSALCGPQTAHPNVGRQCAFRSAMYAFILQSVP